MPGRRGRTNRLLLSVVLAIALPALLLGVAVSPPQGSARRGRPAAAHPKAADPALVERLVANQRATMKRLEQYCYRQRVLDEKFNDDREVTRCQQHDDLVCYYDGVPLYKQLVLNGKATGQKETDPWPSIKRDDNWQKQVRRFDERRERYDQIIAEVPKAFDFEFLGEEAVDGHPASVYRLTPRPGYRAKSRATEMLKHVTGRAWVDEKSGNMLRLFANVEKDFDMWGGLVLKVHKGSTYELRQKPFQGVWLPHFAEERWSARIGLFKFLGQHLLTERSDFKENGTQMNPNSGER